MIPRIRELLDASPFVAFKIRTSDGREYIIPTPDHATITPKGTRVLVFGDDESQTDVAALHVAAVSALN
ncbi:MAG: hypothetical protein M3Y80_08420, partial [Verrucomicrobiota bacterium]|nr:hypothetical protein [Verrucomicrobiota bacterium]